VGGVEDIWLVVAVLSVLDFVFGEEAEQGQVDFGEAEGEIKLFVL
jgi:hypothetical protein